VGRGTVRVEGGIQLRDLGNDGVGYTLEHQLGDAISHSDFEVRVTEVEEEDANGAAVVRIDDTGANMEAKLRS